MKKTILFTLSIFLSISYTIAQDRLTRHIKDSTEYANTIVLLKNRISDLEKDTSSIDIKNVKKIEIEKSIKETSDKLDATLVVLKLHRKVKAKDDLEKAQRQAEVKREEEEKERKEKTEALQAKRQAEEDEALKKKIRDKIHNSPQ